MVEVRQTFRASRIGTIAGCYVTQGKVTRGSQVRIVRDGTVIHDGRIGTAAPFQGRRARGRGGLRVRRGPGELPGRPRGRRARGLRDPSGRARARDVGLRERAMPFVVLMRIHLHFPDNGSLKGKRKELLAARAPFHAGSGQRSQRSTTTTSGSAPRSPPAWWAARPRSWSARRTESSAIWRRDFPKLCGLSGDSCPSRTSTPDRVAGPILCLGKDSPRRGRTNPG